MNDVAPVTRVCGAQTPALNVLFVHGLTGEPIETWSVGEKEVAERSWLPWRRSSAPAEDHKESEFWPAWLSEEFPQIAV